MNKTKNQTKEHKLKDCLHCFINKVLFGICGDCQQYDKCEVCEVIFSEFGDNPSYENPKRCNSCVHFEKNIKQQCFLCEKLIVNDPERFIVKGNMCDYCVSKVFNTLLPEHRRSKRLPLMLKQ